MSQMVYLIRHCQASGQAPDAPLTEVGQQQALALADCFTKIPLQRIISSPFTRAYQSIAPLAERLGLTVERDDRLVERVLSSVPLDDWRQRLAESFVDLDLSFEGGESSLTAMQRGVAVVDEVIQQPELPAIMVTHGNLMALILKHFDQQIGYADWAGMRNPDVYWVQFKGGKHSVQRMDKFVV